MDAEFLYNLSQKPTVIVLELLVLEKREMLFLLSYLIYLEWSELVLSA